MIELDDCGKEFLLNFQGAYKDYMTDAKVVMVVKASRGTMVLFGDDVDGQCQAIKSFMEEHAND